MHLAQQLNEAQKRVTGMTTCGMATYKLIKSLVVPADISTKKVRGTGTTRPSSLSPQTNSHRDAIPFKLLHTTERRIGGCVCGVPA